MTDKELKKYLHKKALIFTEIAGLPINFRGYLFKENEKYYISKRQVLKYDSYGGILAENIVKIEIVDNV